MNRPRTRGVPPHTYLCAVRPPQTWISCSSVNLGDRDETQSHSLGKDPGPAHPPPESSAGQGGLCPRHSCVVKSRAKHPGCTQLRGVTLPGSCSLKAPLSSPNILRQQLEAGVMPTQSRAPGPGEAPSSSLPWSTRARMVATEGQEVDHAWGATYRGTSVSWLRQGGDTKTQPPASTQGQ